MRTRLAIFMPLLIAVVAAACSGSSDSDEVASLGETATSTTVSPGEPDATVDTEEAVIAFTECLRDEGLDVEDPKVDANGHVQLPPIGFVAESEEEMDAAAQELEAAFATCEHHLEGVTLIGSGPESDVAFEDALVEYASCMRSQGIDMPDPDFSREDGVLEMAPELGPGDVEDFEVAHEECQGILSGAGLDF